MPIDSAVAASVELAERQERERVEKPVQEVVLDDSNIVSFADYPYTFRAVNEKILVSIDIFKSGYECRECKGKKCIKYQCACVREGHSGYKYSREQLDSITESLGLDVAAAREKIPCPECQGAPGSVERDESCPSCKGIGHLVIIPESAKNLPTTGVVLSMGKKAKENAEYHIGDRVLFGQHAGSFIPTQAGILLKQLDWYQVYSVIGGADRMGAFDFILRDEPTV